MIQITTLNPKRVTDCWLDRTNNSNRIMYAFTRKFEINMIKLMIKYRFLALNVVSFFDFKLKSRGSVIYMILSNNQNWRWQKNCRNIFLKSVVHFWNSLHICFYQDLLIIVFIECTLLRNKYYGFYQKCEFKMQ